MTPELLASIRRHTPRSLAADALAGVTVAMVALPLSLAIAIASGAPPGAGLVTAVVAGILISALGGSRVQVGGPTGAFIVVVNGVIAAHGYDGLVLATFMAGLILLLAGALRLGRLMRLVPEPVIDGFTLGIAVVIAASQIDVMLGLTLPEGTPAALAERAPAVAAALDGFEPWALAAGLLAMALIVLLRRLAPRWPGLIVAVALVSAGAALLGLPVETLAGRYGDLPSSLPWPALPDLAPGRLAALLPSALVIAFLAGVESLLSAMVADRMTGGPPHRPSAELLAQGWANLGSALFGGLPATGAIARTATNIRAGARSPVAGVIHALVVLAAMTLASDLAGRMALPALAALLILTAWNMSEPQRWPERLRARRADLALMAMTAALTVLVDLTVAIGAGVAVGLALRARRRGVPPADWRPPDR